MSDHYRNNYSRQYSRAQKICEMACGSTQKEVDVCEFLSSEENLCAPIEDDVADRLILSPLPPGADLVEISALSELLGNSFSETPPILSTCHNVEDLFESTTASPNNQQGDDNQQQDNNQQQDESQQQDDNQKKDNNQQQNNDQQEHNNILDIDTSSNNFITNNITPHPSSPECSINHLDMDCINDFCPYFVGNLNHEPLSHQSDFSGYSTPQANTPLSTFSVDGLSPRTETKRIRKDKGNIRRKHVHEWIDTKRKTLKNLGKAYLSRSGITKQKKKMKSPCKCRMKCFEKISNDQRKKVFKAFWKLGDHQRQWEYISHLVRQSHKQRALVEVDSRRKFTIKYNLPLAAAEDSYVKVCKKQFLSTFSISEQFVYTAIQKTDKVTGVLGADNRGKHSNHPIKLTEDVKKSIIDHINSFHPVEAHYVRKDSSKLYLDSDLNFHKLFSMYNEWFDPNIYQGKAETERQYKTVVNENFKLSFFKPKKDQCDICHKYNLLTPTDVQREREAHETHMLNKNTARDLKKEDKNLAKSSEGKIITATFDFQKVLGSPCGEISVFYYKRKLATMNFTVFDLAKKLANCYMWHEGEGKRGANEVASCLADFVSKGVQAGAVEFRFWSDNCTGQNRNRIVFVAYMILAKKYNVTIKHTFLEKGHTQQEGDSVHALIERCSKNKLIYTPFEWFALVRWAKQDGKPYNVIEMDHTKFFDYKSTLDGRNWTKDIQGNGVQWTKIREIKVLAGEPNRLLYKYDLAQQDYKTIVTKTNTRRRRQQNNSTVEMLYHSVLPIPQAKKNDLLSLCNSGVIPQTYHDFYRNLPVARTSNLHNSDSDSE